MAAGRHHAGAAVEHQLVLATDLVDIDDRHVALARARRQGLLAQALLVQVERRGIEVEHQPRAGGTRRGHRLGMPDVLADAQRHRHAGDLHHARLVAGIEVALLVEHLIVGQLLLVVARHQLAVIEQRTGVVAPLALHPGEADQQADAAHLAGQALEGGLSAQLHAVPEQQVFRRIAAQRQLGKHDHIGLPLFAGAPGRLDDALDVAVNVADAQVELGHRDPQDLTHAALQMKGTGAGNRESPAGPDARAALSRNGRSRHNAQSRPAVLGSRRRRRYTGARFRLRMRALWLAY
ncbi:hypothetical protein D3C78_540880 [compost metagenome]